MDKVVKSANEAAEQIIEWSESQKIETCFDRAQRLKPCPIGSTGACCKI
jgi:carbon-monoxide dehydrogenase catalytic subunit